MLIVNKDTKDDIYNSDYIVQFYTNYVQGEATVKAVLHNGAKAGLGKYSTRDAAKAALGLLMKEVELGRKNVFYMPEEREVKASRVGYGTSEQRQQHHATGKKTRGHGGS